MNNEPDQIDMMNEQELRIELRSVLRKLAEQQALFSKLTLMAWPNGNKEFLGEAGFEELTKLLAESKSKAVPEGWQLVPRISTHKMFRAFNFELPVSISDSVFFSNAYNAMLAAAPQPGGSNE